MDKICIVKRRREAVRDDAPVLEAAGQGLPGGPLGISFGSIRPAPPVDGPNGGNSLPNEKIKVFTIAMEPQPGVKDGDGEEIRYFFCMGNEGLRVHAEKDGDGQEIKLYLHFNNVCTFRLLDGKEVCQILQVSRSFLKRLTARGELKGYKIGRMRRFLLEDVLEYVGSKGIFAGGSSEGGNPQ
jgi:excisionase family DNA binding protein